MLLHNRLRWSISTIHGVSGLGLSLLHVRISALKLRRVSSRCLPRIERLELHHSACSVSSPRIISVSLPWTVAQYSSKIHRKTVSPSITRSSNHASLLSHIFIIIKPLSVTAGYRVETTRDTKLGGLFTSPTLLCASGRFANTNLALESD